MVNTTIFLSLVMTINAQPFQQRLISVERNLNVGNWEMTSQALTPDCPFPWSVRKFALHGGKQEGVDLILVDNGKLQMTIIPTRGMGVLRVNLGDVRLGWDSPVKEVVHPAFVDLKSRGGLGWLEGFNEWLCRCGLEFCGHPGEDKFITNVGEEATMELTLHGKIANLPAQEVEVVIDRKPPYRITVRGRVDERMFYGPKLELQTEISTKPGSSNFRISDVISNRGDQDQEFQILYHTNYGRPLLEEGSTFQAPVERITPFNGRASEGMADYSKYAGPTAGFIEQVYCLRLRAGEDGQTVTLLANRAGDRAVSLAYSPEELPYFTLWKNTVTEKEGYVTGLEPGTGFPYNRRVERKFGRVPKLAPGASRNFTIDFGIHVGAEQVKAVSSRITAIQGGREPQVDARPPEVD